MAQTVAAAKGQRRFAEFWARLRAAVLRDPLFVAAFALLWGCALVPLWAPRFLPLLDLPNHIDSIAIWHRYHNAAWGYSKYYDLNLIPVPYWGYFLPVNLLAYLMPIEIANKLYLSAYALALPVSAAVLARQMGRSHRLALLTFPLVFNMSFTFGFITFCAGLVVLTFAIVALDRFLEAPSRRRAVALAALSLALYLTHVLPWLYFGVASIVLAFCHGWHPRRVAAAAACELPSLILAVIGYRMSQGATAVQAGPFTYEAKPEELLGSLQQIPSRVLVGWPSSAPYWILLLLAVLWGALLISGRDDDAATARGGFRYRLELLVLLAALAYVTLPMHLLKPVDWWMIGGRFMTIVALYGALLPRGPIVGRRALVLVPVIVIAAAYPLAMTKKWLEFDRRAASFRRLMRFVERGSSTLTLVMGDGVDPSVDPQAVPYIQFHAYAQYFGGGFDPWAENAGFPYRQRPGTALPSPRWKHPESFTFDAHGVHYDYIITKGEWTDHAIFGPDDHGRAPLIAHDGEWRLYAVGQR